MTNCNGEGKCRKCGEWVALNEHEECRECYESYEYDDAKRDFEREELKRYAGEG